MQDRGMMRLGHVHANECYGTGKELIPNMVHWWWWWWWWWSSSSSSSFWFCYTVTFVFELVTWIIFSSCASSSLCG